MMRRSLAGRAALLAAGAGCRYCSDAPPGYGPGPGQPQVQNALGTLQQERQEFVEAAPDKGGHRAQAIQLVDQAINLPMGMQFAGD
jgi:hypothetical protein